MMNKEEYGNKLKKKKVDVKQIDRGDRFVHSVLDPDNNRIEFKDCREFF